MFTFYVPKSFGFSQFPTLRSCSVFSPDLPLRPQAWPVPLALNVACSALPAMSSRLFVKRLAWSHLSLVPNTCPLALRTGTLCGPVAHRWTGTFWAPRRALILIITSVVIVQTKQAPYKQESPHQGMCDVNF